MKNPTITPGQLLIIKKIENIRHKHRSLYFWQVRMEINKLWNNNPQMVTNYTKNAFFDVFDKINTAYYHLQRIIEEENLIIKIAQQLNNYNEIDSPSGIAGITYEPISYEFEAFIIQSYACLEIFSRTVTIMFKNESGFSGLKKSLLNVKKTKATKLVKLFEKDKYVPLMREFLKDKGTSGRENRRDYSVHFGKLWTGTINVPIAGSQKIIKSYVTELSKKNISPFDSQNLVEFCEDKFYLMCDLIKDSLEILFEADLNTGSKKNSSQRTKTIE